MKSRHRRTAKTSGSKGLFLTFEGGEGAGKSTQIALLAKAFEAQGKAVLLTREPGGSPIADRIRALILDPTMRGLVPLAELLLYEASRAQHIADTILPALDQGKVVICDRFADSSVVYQGAARGLTASLVEQLNRITVARLKPNRTFVLDIDPEEGFRRVGNRGAALDRMEQESLDFHKAVRAGYRRLARLEPRRIRLIDASASSNEVHARILRELRGLL